MELREALRVVVRGIPHCSYTFYLNKNLGCYS